ncbi:hypothetical protein N1030_07290 [Desulfovibrio mangrovi]|uniref:hypothetical protein n=1 Tax=Desulfovibrio mangrovi TaxID=2976983 RepID=UPI00224779EB|nr:hypothetical protein [Desulfovibrio mangrovi]UZP68767.1 hypothetical protein N1030_07290 [Desulfovibrio mangrovi]
MKNKECRTGVASGESMQIKKEMSVVMFMVVLCLLLVAPSGRCADEAPAKFVMTVPLYEGVLKFPLPAWMKANQSMKDLQVMEKKKDGFYGLLFTPKGEELDSWTRFYGVFGMNFSEDWTVARFMDETLGNMQKACKEPWKIVPYDETENTRLISAQCSQLSDAMVRNGRNVESNFLYVGKVNHTMVKVQLVWRGTQEEAASEFWPTNEAVLQETLTRMKSISLLKR